MICLKKNTLFIFRHFSEKYSRAFDSEWYKRAVEHHAIEPESFVFSVPFRDGSEAEDLSGRPPLVLATHAVFVESRAHRAPAAVVGLHFQLDSLARHFLNVTSTVSYFTLLPFDKPSELTIHRLIDLLEIIAIDGSIKTSVFVILHR